MKKKQSLYRAILIRFTKATLEYFNNAKALCDELFVIVNSDHQRELKGSKAFSR